MAIDLSVAMLPGPLIIERWTLGSLGGTAQPPFWIPKLVLVNEVAEV